MANHRRARAVSAREAGIWIVASYFHPLPRGNLVVCFARRHLTRTGTGTGTGTGIRIRMRSESGPKTPQPGGRGILGRAVTRYRATVVN